MENPALIQGPPSRPDAICRDSNLVCCKKATTPPPCDQGDGYQCSDIQVRKNSKLYKVKICLCVSVVFDNNIIDYLRK